MSILTGIQGIIKDRDEADEPQHPDEESVDYLLRKEKAEALTIALTRFAKDIRMLRMQNVKIGCSKANVLLPTNEQLDKAIGDPNV